MSPPDYSPSGHVISTILRHDRKQTSYKIALLRSINDIVLSYPGFESENREVAVPLLRLAEYWMAYYWPFVDPEAPIYQGPRSTLGGDVRNDMAFRPALTELRQIFEAEHHGGTGPSDGFFLINEWRISRKRESFSNRLKSAYRLARKKVADSIRMPIRYAGVGEWEVFDKPEQYYKLSDNTAAIPGTKGNFSCLVVSSDLWKSFRDLSLWVEALCIHEWCLFSEQKVPDASKGRGEVFELLTVRPDNRVALTWERNQIDILLMEGKEFVCPYTKSKIRTGSSYDLDHLLPLVVYPVNEMWNLILADPQFNQSEKRDKIPSERALREVRPLLIRTYDLYREKPALRAAFREDVESRFASVDVASDSFSSDAASAAVSFVDRIATFRNLARFDLP